MGYGGGMIITFFDFSMSLVYNISRNVKLVEVFLDLL